MHPKAYAEDLLPYKAITLQAFFYIFTWRYPTKLISDRFLRHHHSLIIYMYNKLKWALVIT